jgi:hypothetical protein
VAALCPLSYAQTYRFDTLWARKSHDLKVEEQAAAQSKLELMWLYAAG